MKAKHVFILLALSCAFTVGATLMKVQRVEHASLMLAFAMFFQIGVFGFIAYKVLSKKNDSL
ncbi:hypothetical protein [Flavobacterium selenitireducens]|uniref:hypothetical protein n=1 Tax=Flavobacterium selenitireducens TaxID=2722704 RepID=UPI00168BA555|nr:hypothetical protein [Flavobacterium selenitireducens]MBD3581780.1 hypothetical protein [Flavobacterium selenitireducens]